MEYETVSHTMDERPLVHLPSGRDVAVTVHHYEGGSGPTVYLQAAQHGIELNGTAALRRLHHHLASAELAGTVVVVPVVNSLAFDHGSYVTPQAVDAVNPNFNRVWPGDGNGTFQERLAAQLWQLIETADIVIDLHTGTADMLEHVRFQDDDPDSRRLAAMFGTEYLLTNPELEETDGDDFSGKLRTAAAHTDIPTIVPELSNSRRIDRDAARRGVNGIRNILAEVGMLREEPSAPPSQTILLDDGGRIGADRSGLFEPNEDVAVGDRVSEGTELGTVYCPATFEERQSVRMPESGVVYSLTRESVVTAGEKIACLAAVE